VNYPQPSQGGLPADKVKNGVMGIRSAHFSMNAFAMNMENGS